MGIMEKMRLDGKSAFVTGGARGIGMNYATALAEAFFFTEFIAHTPDSDNVYRIVWVGFYLFSQFTNERGKITSIFWHIFKSPYILVKLFFGKYLSFM